MVLAEIGLFQHLFTFYIIFQLIFVNNIRANMLIQLH